MESKTIVAEGKGYCSIPGRRRLADALPVLALLLLHAAASAAAEADVPAQAQQPAAPASAPVAGAGSEPSPPKEPLPFKDWKWEGAIGPVVSVSPDYSGSGTRNTSLTPGFYLRYGRLTASNTGGFVTRRNNDDIFRGLGLDLKRDDRVRFNVALRLDNGRRSADSRGLEGIEDVRRTLRARFSGTWHIAPAWKLGSGLSVDLLNRGGGNIVDLGVAHDRRWDASTTWTLSAALTAGDARYMRSWYGIDAAASAASGRALYAPGAGLRDVGFGTGWRTEIGEDWIVLWGASVSRLLGPAARSPLTTSVRQWGASVGVARRF